MPDPHSKICFITCPSGLEDLLAAEIRSFDIAAATQMKVRRAGVDCPLTVRELYTVCLWSRIANRVLYPLHSFRIKDEKSYYDGVQEIDWEQCIKTEGTLAVDFFCQSSCITHSLYGAQLTKDAVVDWFSDKYDKRPSVDRVTPDTRINVYLFKNRARVSLDVAGGSLHRRNYRRAAGEAPLKENLAAGVLQAARWPELASRGAPLTDPMCGSGTLLIEAAMMAADIAPGLLREHHGFFAWQEHDADAWFKALADAQERKTAGLEYLPEITGYDSDGKVVEKARKNIQAAGLQSHIQVSQADFFKTEQEYEYGPGLLVMNPPYGERLLNDENVGVFYSRMGRALRRVAPNWELALFTGNPKLFHRTGLARQVVLECRNGDIECKLFTSVIPAANVLAPGESRAPIDVPDRSANSDVPGLDALHDRLKKNVRTLSGWLKSSAISNYRLYDADLPDFAFALDVYQSDDGLLVNLQEYRAPKKIDPVLAQKRITAAVPIVCEVLDCSLESVAVKRRDKQRGESQYQRLEKTNRFHTVAEGGCRLLVNLTDYLDTGLFLDHRKIRLWLGKNSKDQRLLNLYCYTAAASVHAAVGGAKSSVSVDLSRNYLEWAGNNFSLNNIDTNKHQLVRADCMQWVKKHDQQYDLIFLDPPTFSNSTAMEDDWDVQTHHESMIDDCMALLATGGTLIFSNNFRRFKLAEKISEKYQVDNRSTWSLQRDFARNPRIHQCWFIKHPS